MLWLGKSPRAAHDRTAKNKIRAETARISLDGFAVGARGLFARDWHQRLEKTRVFEPSITLTPFRHRAPRILLSSAGRPFSAAHFLGHCFGLIPASVSFASSAFPVPPYTIGFPPIKQPLALEAEATRFWVPKKMGQKKETFLCPTYMLSGIALR